MNLRCKLIAIGLAIASMTCTSPMVSGDVPWEMTFGDCMTGPNEGPVHTRCLDAEFDGDTDVDLADWAILQVLCDEERYLTTACQR